MATVAQELFAQFIQHPDRDLVSLTLLVATGIGFWAVKNVYWTPQHLGGWTRRAQDRFDFDDAAIKALCSTAPFLADVLLSPYHILCGLGLKPSTREKLKEMDKGFTQYMLGRANEDQRKASLLEELRQELTRMALNVATLDEEVRVTHPLRMNEIESSMTILENATRSAGLKAAELEELYVISLDESIEKALDRQLSGAEETLELDLGDTTVSEDLYQQMLEVQSKTDKKSCFC
jgi:hypothetical protein